MSSTTHDPRWLSNSLGAFKNYEELFPLKKDWLRKVAEGRTEESSNAGGGDFEIGMRRYGTSKLLMNLLMHALDRRLLKSLRYKSVSMLALDPGAIGGTSLYTHFPTYLYICLNYILLPLQFILVYFFPNGRFRTVEKTGRDLMRVCFDEAELGERPGPLYLNGSERAEGSVESRIVEKQEECWVESRVLAGEIGGLVESNWEGLVM